MIVYRTDYLVHQLPESLEYLKVRYGILESKILLDYIKKKISMFKIESETDQKKKMNLNEYTQNVLTKSILKAQEFCEKRLGKIFVFEFVGELFSFRLKDGILYHNVKSNDVSI